MQKYTFNQNESPEGRSDGRVRWEGGSWAVADTAGMEKRGKTETLRQGGHLTQR